MDVVTPEQAKIAEDAGAVAVMALERVPADIRAQGGVARMSDPDMIEGIIAAVSIPVMAKAQQLAMLVVAITYYWLSYVLLDRQQGMVNFTDDPSMIPPRYRGKAKVGEDITIRNPKIQNELKEQEEKARQEEAARPRIVPTPDYVPPPAPPLQVTPPPKRLG